jgi:membrane glycosyltransferase
MPPLARASMTPRPWAGRALLRGLLALVSLGASGRERSLRPDGDVRPLRIRRLVLLVLVVAGALTGTQAMAEILPEHGATWIEKFLLVLFGILFGWISAGFWTAVMGAFQLVRGRGHSPLLRGLSALTPLPIDAAARTAIVMPICNEKVSTVFGGLHATIDSLAATGEGGCFDVFVLSDTSDPAIRAAEQAAWTRLEADLAARQGGTPQVAVHYRWRQRRTQRKAGNVADFCRRWGRAYRYLVVLDADSVMSGECLTTLVRLMEAHPRTGIIQTAPRAVGRETFHARVLQFASRAYGPLFTAGMRFWQLGESHYWGHNAILRVAPFLEHGGLAPIRGVGPLAGDILSHDFVEAALMRRAGWQVWVADELEGSYEQVPPNLVTELQRDRRWCQGNLQNAQLLFEPDLHAVHRTTFLTGVLAYASSPLWLAFLVMSSWLFASHAGQEPTYFLEPYQLFPIWPTANLALTLTLFGLTAVLLFAPKLLSIAAIGLRGEAGRFGGAWKLVGSAAIEFLHSLLLAPVRMLFHTGFVLAAMTGWKLDWRSPPRDDAATSFREAVRRHGLHTLLALVWIAVLVKSSEHFPWWLSPILAGLLLAIPLSVWGSRTSIGRALRRRRLLLTPEENRQPSVLAAADRYAARIADEALTIERVVGDRATLEAVAQALPARPRARPGAKSTAAAARVERALAEGPDALAPDDRLRLLSDAGSLGAIAEAVAAHRAHPRGGPRRRRSPTRAWPIRLSLRPPTRCLSRQADPTPGGAQNARMPGTADDAASLRRILRAARTVAVVGLSADWFRPSHFAAKYMLSHGYRVVPVNPRYETILGQPCHASLATIEGPIDCRRRLPQDRRRAADRRGGDRRRRPLPLAADRRRESRGGSARRSGGPRDRPRPLRQDRARAALRRPRLGRRQHARGLGAAAARRSRGPRPCPTDASTPRRSPSTPGRSPTAQSARVRCRSTRRRASSSRAPSSARLFNLQTFGNVYSRLSNPTVAVLEERVAALEGGRAAVAAASGMAAESLALLTLLQHGDHVVASHALYGGTVTLFSVNLARLGIETTFVDATQPEAFAAAMRPNTRAVFAESLGNPSLVVLDIAAVAEVAHAHGVPLIVDNTVPSPFLCNPIEHGADIVVHSATKYLGGHGTTLAGVVVESGRFPWDNGKFPGMTEPSPGYHGVRFYETFGDFGFTMRVRMEALRVYGPALSPSSAWQILQGIETLLLRMERHCANALRGGALPGGDPRVAWVDYPGLESPRAARPGPQADALVRRGPGRLRLLAFGVRGDVEAACASSRRLRCSPTSPTSATRAPRHPPGIHHPPAARRRAAGGRRRPARHGADVGRARARRRHPLGHRPLPGRCVQGVKG